MDFSFGFGYLPHPMLVVGALDQLLPLPLDEDAAVVEKKRRRTATHAKHRAPTIRANAATATAIAAAAATDAEGTDGDNPAPGVEDVVHGGYLARSHSHGRVTKSVLALPAGSTDDDRCGKFNFEQLVAETLPDVIVSSLVGPETFLLHHVMTPEALMLAYNVAMARDHNDNYVYDFETCMARLPDLVGKVVPLCSRLSGGNMKTHEPKFLPKGSTPHIIAQQPFFASIVTSFANDAGCIAFEGVTLSPLGFNYPLEHEKRLKTGLSIGDAFEDTWALVLVTHVYTMTKEGKHPFIGIPWSAINPNATYAGDDGSRCVDANAGGRNQFPCFKWTAYTEAHPEQQKTSGATTFGLAECKQVRGMFRKLLAPLVTAARAHENLEAMRAAGTLDDSLVHRLASARQHAVAREQHRRGKTTDDYSSNDLRKMLLAEMLLDGTPLAGVLTRDASKITLPEIPSVDGMFETLRQVVGSSSATRITSYQGMYETWLGV